jgi:uncharacterized protein YndB with AHSA1/START domain
MSNNNVIDQSITVNASREQVFNALVEAGGLTRWFLSKAESEAKAGGWFNYSWEFNDADQNGSQEGAYTEVVRPEKVSYPWQAGDTPTKVTFTVQGDGDKVTVQLVHSGFGAAKNPDQLREMHAGPWQFYMANLKNHLENGGDLRAEQLGQVTY